MMNENTNLYGEIGDAQPIELATESGNPDIDSLDSQFLKHIETESSQLAGKGEEAKPAEPLE